MQYFILIIILIGLVILINRIKFIIKNTKAINPTKIYSREFTITKKHPEYDGENVEYISVNKDGSATVKTLLSGEILKAQENKFFKGKDYGSHGLQLISILYDEQKMILKRYLPEDLEDE